MVRRATHGTPALSIALVVLATLVVAATHALVKVALLRSGSDVWTLAFDPLLIGALALTAVGGALVTYALKHGELSAIYPLISLGFVWVALEGVLFFDEKISPVGIAGIVIIFAGVSLIGHHSMRGSKTQRGERHGAPKRRSSKRTGARR